VPPRLTKLLRMPSLAAVLALVVALPITASAEEARTFRGKVKGGSVVFRPVNVKPSKLLGGYVRVGGRRVELRYRRLRRAVETHRLRVRPGRRVLRRRRSRPRLVLRTRELPEFDGSSRRNGSIFTSADQAYRGSFSVLADFPGNTKDNAYARAWDDVSWDTGTDVWYGAALYIPSISTPTYADLLRWDNAKSRGSDGDVGGIELEDGRLSLIRRDYDGENDARIIGPFDFPRDRWFWIEVHQRFSALDGFASNEVLLDGAVVGRSTQANSRGRHIDDLRVGLVYVEGAPSRVYVDRFGVSISQRGPLR